MTRLALYLVAVNRPFARPEWRAFRRGFAGAFARGFIRRR